MTREQETEVRIPEIDRYLRQGIASADRERGAGLETLVRVVEAREAGLQREYERLSKVLPSTDPRLEALILRKEASRALREEVDFEIARTKTGVPAPDKEQWTLHGFVRGADTAVLADLTAALLDARGTVIAGTDSPMEKDGRFLLRFKAPQQDAGRERAPRQAFQVFFGLLDARRRVLYSDSRALDPENGRVTFPEVNLPATREPPSPPRPRPRPDDTRTTDDREPDRRTRRTTPAETVDESPAPRATRRRPAQQPPDETPPRRGRRPQ
jgi:hypothetical protein